MSKKTHWKKAFHKEFLGAHDLEEGEDLKAVINHVEVRKIKGPDGREEERNIAIFKGDVKPMILNVGACQKIQKFTKSKYIDDWKDVAVQIYVQDNVKAFGGLVDALRLRDQQPRMTKPTLTPDHKRWADAVKAVADPNKGMPAVLDRFEVTPEFQRRLVDEAAGA